ncbi:MAG TPA: hypothetical protein VFS67_32695 [Polyangiaceae bacterium]|nr:hypothetical protein [Polyangiaceae bacterium]
MTNQAPRPAPARPASSIHYNGAGSEWGEVGELIRRFCADRGRHGFRLGGRELNGHLFIDHGRVIHAEYGEDFGLNAILKLLRAGPMRLESWRGAWPRQASIQLPPERLLDKVAPIGSLLDTRVVRKVLLPTEHTEPAEPARRSAPPAARQRARPAADVSSARAAHGPPTTMVRLTMRGRVLTARGKDARRVAEAAALIHALAQLIAADLGRRGTPAVHVRGREKSLLVLRSEVNDIAAACGSTRRLASLIGRAGL